MTRRKIAWMIVLFVDVLYMAWGAAAAIAPRHLLGPGGRPILPAGYEGFTGGSWAALVADAPRNAAYMEVLFRMFGSHCVIFGFLGSIIAATAFRRGETWAWWALLAANTTALLSAMSYDLAVKAIGPFEVTEYLGLALVWTAFAMTAPFRRGARAVPAVSGHG